MEGTWVIEYTTGTARFASVLERANIYFYGNGTFYYAEKRKKCVGKWVLKDKLYMRFPYLPSTIYIATVKGNKFHSYHHPDGNTKVFKAIKTSDIPFENKYEDHLPDIDIDGLEYIKTREEEIILNEVGFLIDKITNGDKKWADFAIDRIKNIYKNNKNLPKYPLFEYVDEFFEIIGEDALCKNCHRANLTNLFRIFNSIKSSECRQKIAYNIIKSGENLNAFSFRFNKDDVVEEWLDAEDVMHLIKNNLYTFDETFFQNHMGILDEILQTENNSDVFLKILNIITSLPSEKIELYLNEICGQYCDFNRESIINRLLTLYKMAILTEEMAPTGICGKLIIDSHKNDFSN